MDARSTVALVVASYAAGAVPSGVVLGRWLVNVDLRRHGSGATGATNALRVLGWRISLAVFAFDFMKGLLPVVLGRWIGLDGWSLTAVGLASVVGHCWSPFIRFRGGKGMATGAGAAAGIYPWVLLVLPLMVLIVAVTRYVSLASLTGSATATVVMAVLGLRGVVDWSAVALVVAITAIIVITHLSNIRRLLAGTERRFGEPAATADGAS